MWPVHTQALLIPIFVALTAASTAATPITHSERVTLVQNEETRRPFEPSSGTREPAITDEQKRANEAAFDNARKLSGIIQRHEKELRLPGVVDIILVGDGHDEWIRVMVKELTPQLDHQLPSELEGVWVQVVDQTRYEEIEAAAKYVVDENSPWLMKRPGIEGIGVGGDPYSALDLWILIDVDKITPQVQQELPAEMSGFPVHLLEVGGPARF
jgi:hypothetical protein